MLIVQYVWRFLRSHKIDLSGRKSWCESNDSNFTAKAADVVSLYVAPPKKAILLCVDENPLTQALERAQGYLKLPNGRALTGQSHDYKRHGTTNVACGAWTCHRKCYRGTFKTPPRRVPQFHGRRHSSFSRPQASRHPRRFEHPREKRALAQGSSQCEISCHVDQRVLAQLGRGLALDLTWTIAERRFLHKPPTT
jgi:hypothetical protein